VGAPAFGTLELHASQDAVEFGQYQTQRLARDWVEEDKIVIRVRTASTSNFVG
jgi:hypothetical protein